MAQHDNTGGLWENQYKGKHKKRPDFTGTITIDGKVYQLSGWENHRGKGYPRISLRVTPKDVPPKPKAEPKPAALPKAEPPMDFDDDIPF